MATTIHAWFAAQTALRDGSCVYSQPGGAQVNVTRMNAEKEGKGAFPHDEKYVGEVVSQEDGGCVSANFRVPGITRKEGVQHHGNRTFRLASNDL